VEVGTSVPDDGVQHTSLRATADSRDLAMRFSTAALGATVMATVFVLMPWMCVVLNAAVGWPHLFFPGSTVIGGLLIIAGAAGALMCSRTFRRVGFGTPVPTEPARELIESGPYRFSRNPIYIAEFAILVGIALHRGELMLFAYGAAFLAAAHVWVVRHEEPVLEQRFGDRYRAYCNAVPRWIGGGKASRRIAV